MIGAAFVRAGVCVIKDPVLFAVLGLAADLINSHSWRSRLLAGAVALLVASGSLVNLALGVYWRTASQQQHRVLTAIRSQFPVLPSRTVLLLDGVCPFVGPAPIFHSEDFGSALRLLYNDLSLDGSVINPEFEIHTDHVVAKGWAEQSFPFSEHLLLIRPGDPEVCRLRDAQAAASCIARVDPSPVRCGPGGLQVRFWELFAIVSVRRDISTHVR